MLENQDQEQIDFYNDDLLSPEDRYRQLTEQFDLQPEIDLGYYLEVFSGYVWHLTDVEHKTYQDPQSLDFYKAGFHGNDIPPAENVTHLCDVQDGYYGLSQTPETPKILDGWHIERVYPQLGFFSTDGTWTVVLIREHYNYTGIADFIGYLN